MKSFARCGPYATDISGERSRRQSLISGDFGAKLDYN